MVEIRRPLVTEAELMSANVNADGDLEFTRDSGLKINAGRVRPDVTADDVAAAFADPGSAASAQLDSSVRAAAEALVKSDEGIVRVGSDATVQSLDSDEFSFLVRGSNRRAAWNAAASDGSMPPHAEAEVRERVGLLADEAAADAGYATVVRGANGAVGAGSVLADGSWAPQSVSAMRRALGVRTLVGIGDSITEGSSAQGTNHVRAAASKAGLAAVVSGWPGAPANTISFRAGAFELMVTFPSNTIPTGTSPVAVTVDATTNWYSGPNAAYHAYPVALGNGVTGVLTRDQSAGTWSFVRDAGSPYVTQEAIVLPGPVSARCTSLLDVIRDPSSQVILWQGRNGVKDATTHSVILDRDRQVARLARGRYWAYSILPMHSETVGSAARTTLDALNNARRGLHGSAYRDVSTWLIDNGLAAAGVTPTSDDLDDISNRVIPRSLLGDATDLVNGVHPNAAGVRALTTFHLAQLAADGLN